MRDPVLAAWHGGGLRQLCGGAAGGKLRAAARRWLGAGGGADEAQEDARQLGIALDEDETDGGDVPVLAQNWEIVMAFLAIQTQWRYAPSGHLTGLDYAACKTALAALGVRFKKVFARLQIMEAAALSAQYERERK